MNVAKKAHVWKRDALDWYVEPIAATEALLQRESFSGECWDPCCGGGNIIKTLIAAGHKIIATDIVRRTGEPWFGGELDFLAAEGFRVPNIVMNPPFFRAKGAEAFIRRALTLASDKVAAFVDIRFLVGAERANGIYADFPPSRIWFITPRVSCPPGEYLADGGKAGNGSSDWVWLVWDKANPGAATKADWLRRAA